MATPPIEELFISDPKQKREKKGNDYIKNEPSKISDTFLSRVRKKSVIKSNLQELLAEDGKLLYALCDCAGTDTYDQLAVALLTCFEHRSVNDAMRLLRSTLSREVEKTSISKIFNRPLIYVQPMEELYFEGRRSQPN